MNRKEWLLVIGLSLLAGFLGGGLSAQIYMAGSSHYVLKTNEIQLLDQSGRIRAEWVTGVHGEPGLALYDSAGEPRITLGLGREEEPSLNLLDEAGGIVWSTQSPLNRH